MPFRPVPALAAAATALSACGTTYQIPEFSPGDLERASLVVSEERAAAAGSPPVETAELIAMYEEVVERTEPVAERFCVEQTEGEPCDFDIRVNPDPAAAPNAFHTYGEDGRPQIVLNLAFLELVRAPDELAFVLGHEAGHHIGDHIAAKQAQAAGGAVIGAIGTALLLGLAGAAGGGYSPYQTHQNQQTVEAGGMVGAAIGGQAYSQTYELESDHLGAYIAERAGYDPVLGSRIFARLSATDDGAPALGEAAFWSTHPSSPERVALVERTVTEIAAQRAQGLTPRPAAKAR